jgi:hypothetical protein
MSMPTEISPPKTPKCIQKAKNYTIGSKIEMCRFTKEGAHTVCSMCGPTQPSVHKMHDYVRENPCTYLNDTSMELVSPSTTSSLTPNTI